MPGIYQNRFLLMLPLVCFMFLLQPNSARACGCWQRPTVLDGYQKSDVILIARATSMEKVSKKEAVLGDPIRSTTVEIEKVFKGKVRVGDKIVFGQGNGIDCAWMFDEEDVGKEFLFYLNSPDNRSDPWYVYGCGRSNRLSRAADDLLYLNNPNKVRGKTRVSGTYGNGDPEDSDFTGAHKKIRIIGKNKTYETKTDKHGVYELYGLPAGKYLLEPELPPGWRIDPESLPRSPSYSQKAPGTTDKRVAFTLRPGKHAGIDFSLAIDNAVSGSVHDSNGKPMPEVDAVLVPITAKNAHEQIGGSENTDKNGRFEIKSIEPGSYVLVLNEDGIRTNREPFDTIYYSNVSQRENATVITIAAGQFLRNIDIVVPAVETITVRGALRYSDNKPVPYEWVGFKAEKVGNVEGSVTTKSDARGRFSMTVMKGLKGELSSDFSASSTLYEECRKLPRTSGRSYAVIKSPANRIEAEHDLYNVVLRFPFSACRTKK